jgi:autotransporter-associated beta strand protein
MATTIDTNANNVTIAQAMAADSTSTGGGLTKSGSGILTFTGALTYTGPTTINAGTMQINSAGTTALAAISGAGALAIGDDVVDNTLTAASINVGTLTLSAGSTLVIDAIPGGPAAAHGNVSPVPEPSTLAMLGISASGLIWSVWRRKKKTAAGGGVG